MTSQPLATLEVSPFRRWIALIMLMGLAVILLYLGLGSTAGFGYKLFLGTVGVLALWMARGLHRGTSLTLILDDRGLSLSDGRTLASLDNIEKVDRGMFAFKPSNGFLVRLKQAPGRTWQPGLFWVVGRRLGIGGVTSPGDAKVMADILAAMLAER